MESICIEAAVAVLEHRLLTYEPQAYVTKTIHSVKDIHSDRYTLKRLVADDATVRHIAQIIVDVIEHGGRMRTLECLKVLRALCKSDSGMPLEDPTLEKLFRIYQAYVFDYREEVQWCVSAILKDRQLPDFAIDWLIANADQSEHIANRLLLYPVSNDKITCWASYVYANNYLPHRLSEVIALIVNSDNMADFISQKVELETLAWAVYKSHLSPDNKVSLLKDCCSLGSLQSIIDISERMGTSALLQHFLHKLRCMISDD